MATLVGTGAKMYRGDAASPEVFTEITQLRSASSVGASRSLIDVTHCSSTQRTYKLALKDGDELSFTHLYDPDDTAQSGLFTDMNNGTSRNFRLDLSDSPATQVAFTGLVVGWNIDNNLETEVPLNYRVKVTSGPTYT